MALFYILDKSKTKNLIALAQAYKTSGLAESEIEYLEKLVNAKPGFYGTIAYEIISMSYSNSGSGKLTYQQIRDIFNMLKFHFPKFLEQNHDTAILSPLEHAISIDDDKVVDVLLDMDVTVEGYHFKGAVYFNKHKSLKVLLAKKLDVAKNYCIENPDNNLLHESVWKYSKAETEVIELLMKNIFNNQLLSGLSPDIKGPFGRTSLQAAVINDKPEAVKALIAGGANTNILDKNGNNLFVMAIKYSSNQVLEIEKSINEGQYQPTVSKTIEILHEHDKSNINKYYVIPDHFTCSTPLIKAVYSQNPDTIYTLLLLGADPNKTTMHRDLITEHSKGSTEDSWFLESPLSVAFEVYQSSKYTNIMVEIFKLLLEHDADPDFRKKDYNYPLRSKKLTEFGTILCKTSYSDKNFKIAKLLLEHGASTSLPTIEDKGFKTPLHIACENKSYKIAKLLLENGADKEAKDIDGKIPFDYLEEEVDWDAISLTEETQQSIQESFTGKITECFNNVYACFSNTSKAPEVEESPMDVDSN